MKVLVDTCVWSLALRRNSPMESPYVVELRDLITEFRVQMMGPVRQELLSGVRSPSQFKTLRGRFRAFPDLELVSADFELAAEFFNNCRGHGVQGSNTDFLICAAAERRKLPILTTDGDFLLFQKYIPVVLHPPRI